MKTSASARTVVVCKVFMAFGVGVRPKFVMISFAHSKVLNMNNSELVSVSVCYHII